MLLIYLAYYFYHKNQRIINCCEHWQAGLIKPADGSEGVFI
jgi:hypothetical protein